MNFDITGSLLERIVEISNQIKITVAETAVRVFNLGLDQLGKAQEEGTSETTFPNNGPFLTTKIIGIHEWPSILTDEQKQVTREQLSSLPLREIAAGLGVSVAEVFRARNEIIRDFVSQNWQTMSDSEMAKKLGFKWGTQIAKIRFGLKLHRESFYRESVRDEINPDELRKAITAGGETLTGFCRKRNILVTREYIRQIAGDFGIDTKHRTPLWYANKCGHPELGDKTAVERLLAEKGRAPSAAAAVGLTESKFLRICKAHGITPPKNRPPVEMVELTCSQCGSVFKRLKTLVESQKGRHPEQKTWFCTKKCQGKMLGSLRGSGETVKLTCAVCGKSFERLACLVKEGQNHFFCNKECRYKLLPRGTHRSGRVELTCDNCGKTFTRIASRASKANKTGKHFCGSHCCGEFLNKTYCCKQAN